MVSGVEFSEPSDLDISGVMPESICNYVEYVEQNILARPCLRPLIHHLFLPSLALGPGILLRDDVGGRYNPYVIPEKNAGT
uniref:Uncharacterized protein n=2 Tax=Candidatus Kentrum sp. FW TaxID=2126338 RepID=A0A450TSK4_9GAMM|nr:MAG: hypothetical protein BECKFW1821C_GA0114237_102725 [Candidatus Kentron sp. FW]